MEDKNKENTENKYKKYGKNNETGKVYTDEVRSENEKLKLGKWAQGSKKFFENLTWLTSNEAAEYLRLSSVGVLRVLVCQRRIPFYKLGRNLRFKRAELDRLIEASKNGGL